MKIHSNFTVNHWSGGTTTELFIYPPESSLNARNFQFRLSTATLETAESIFTALPEVRRHLMMLQGEIILQHQAHHHKRLLPFEQDHFEGDWTTKSIGRGKDFNLMFIEPYKGSIEHVRLAQNQLLSISPNTSAEKLFIYLHSGQIHSSVAREHVELWPNQLLEIHTEKVDLEARAISDLVLVKVKL